MNKETREAAAKALADKWYRCKDLDGTIAWLSAVDAVAPLLEGPLQREVEELKAGWAQTRENYRLSLDTNNETVSGLQRENEALRQERDDLRNQGSAHSVTLGVNDRATLEAQLAAAKEVVGKIRERSVGHDADSAFGELWDALADIHTLAASVVPSAGRPG